MVSVGNIFPDSLLLVLLDLLGRFFSMLRESDPTKVVCLLHCENITTTSLGKIPVPVQLSTPRQRSSVSIRPMDAQINIDSF